MERLRWVFLAYRMPREPSTPRIGLWRKLRRLGAVGLVDGLVVLPFDARTKEQFEWLADEVVEAGGDASLWIAHATSARHERDLIGQFRTRAAAEYTALTDEAGLDAAAEPRTLARLRRELRRIERRDFFPPPEREVARAAVNALTARRAAAELSS